MNNVDFILAFDTALSKLGLINFVRVDNCLIVSKNLVSSDKSNITITKIAKDDLIAIMNELGCKLSMIDFIHNVYTMKPYISRIVVGIENGKLDLAVDLLVNKTFPTISFEEGDYENRKNMVCNMDVNNYSTIHSELIANIFNDNESVTNLFQSIDPSTVYKFRLESFEHFNKIEFKLFNHYSLYNIYMRFLFKNEETIVYYPSTDTPKTAAYVGEKLGESLEGLFGSSVETLDSRFIVMTASHMAYQTNNNLDKVMKQICKNVSDSEIIDKFFVDNNEASSLDLEFNSEKDEFIIHLKDIS